MEVRSLLGLNSAVKKNPRTDPRSHVYVTKNTTDSPKTVICFIKNIGNLSRGLLVEPYQLNKCSAALVRVVKRVRIVSENKVSHG